MWDEEWTGDTTQCWAEDPAEHLPRSEPETHREHSEQSFWWLTFPQRWWDARVHSCVVIRDSETLRVSVRGTMVGWFQWDRSQTHLTSVDCKRRDSRTKTETLRLLHAHPASEGSFKTEHLSLISESLSLNTLMGLCSRKTHLSSGTSVIDMSVCLLKSTTT